MQGWVQVWWGVKPVQSGGPLFQKNIKNYYYIIRYKVSSYLESYEKSQLNTKISLKYYKIQKKFDSLTDFYYTLILYFPYTFWLLLHMTTVL